MIRLPILRWFFLALLALPALVASGNQLPQWFNHGLHSVITGFRRTDNISARNCRTCHENVYRDWAGTRHAQAWTNPVFREGFLVESQDRCIYCHAPLRKQFLEIKSGKKGILVHEGVTCTACHVRDSRIYASDSSGTEFHPWLQDKTLASPKFCAGCHQFDFNQTINGHAFLVPEVVQNTYQEWLNYRARGGQGTCQSCHMPGGRHLFAGAHSAETLRKAISIAVSKSSHGYEFKIRSHAVGHRIPTGDLFRHLTLDVARPAGRYETVAVIGRVYGISVDSKTGEVRQSLLKDTSMDPFETRDVKVNWKGPLRFRLVYHFASPRGELDSRLDPSLLQTVVASGRIQ